MKSELVAMNGEKAYGFPIQPIPKPRLGHPPAMGPKSVVTPVCRQVGKRSETRWGVYESWKVTSTGVFKKCPSGHGKAEE